MVTSQWHDAEGERARRYYFITDDGRKHLAAFRTEWTAFAATVRGVLFPPAIADASGDKQDEDKQDEDQQHEDQQHENRTGEPR